MNTVTEFNSAITRATPKANARNWEYTSSVGDVSFFAEQIAFDLHASAITKQGATVNTFIFPTHNCTHGFGKEAWICEHLQIQNMVYCAVCSRWIWILFVLAALPTSAQEALQNSLTGDAAAQSRTQQMQSQNYTFKKGDFEMMVVPSMGLNWNDNVNLAQTNAMDDFIVAPSAEISITYPLTKRNLLSLDFTAGYNWYLMHPDFSSFFLNSSSQTGLSFDFVIKDVTLNLHDWVSYIQGVGQGSSVANTANAAIANTASFGTFQNTAGLSGSWDLNQVTLSLGYDHQNVLATSSAFDNISHSSEMLFARAALQVHPKATVGLESTASFTTYDKNVLNDNDAYTVGPYIEFRPGTFFQLTVRGGFTEYEFQQTSTQIQTASQNTWYASVTVTHQPTDSISYSMTAGREVQLGISSDLLEDWYVRPDVTLKIIKGLDLIFSLFYEHGNEGAGSVGNVSGSSNGAFDWYGGDLKIQHALTKRLSMGLDYRLTLRSSGMPNGGYTQNLVGLQLTYYIQ
jgi:hypothetical protein